MRMSLAKIKNKRQLESVLLICALVATSIVIVLPLSSPKAKGQVVHNLPGGMMQEDAIGAPYDMGPSGDSEVIWDGNQDHIIALDYIIPPGWTLDIPALNYTPPFGNFGELRISFQIPASKIEVRGNPGNPGRLITNYGAPDNDYTAFLGTPPMFWDGIYFKRYSEGCINNVYINQSQNGIVFEPGSNLISPGVSQSRLRTYTNQAMFLNGTLGYTTIMNTRFVGTNGTSGTGLVVKNCTLNLTGGTLPGVRFDGHSPGTPGLIVSDAEVIADTVIFDGNTIAGPCVRIEGIKSNATVFSACSFIDGAFGDYYIEANGSSSPLITDCLFEQSLNELTIIANDNASGVPAHPILRNPIDYNGGVFLNTTLSATGSSSVTLQWYLDVYVIDPDGNPIAGSTVTVDGAIPGAPGMPSSMITASVPPAERGWARGFITTEFILYSSSVTNYNPYNVSADNLTAIGYAIPEVTMDVSKFVIVIVPFSIIPNMPPSVFWVGTPPVLQGGDIEIEYILYDPNPGDNGSLSIIIMYSFDNSSWIPANIASGSPSTTNLDNNTRYKVIWDSSFDLPGQYRDPVYIQIVPSDPWASGTPDSTGNFIVDNEPPIILTMPELKDVTNTTATINWTVDQPATASLWWGLDDTLTTETTGSTVSATQSVTLTGLQPGRKYTYAANSTDQFGNSVSTYPMIFVFYTEVHIQLYKGWNMISIPPDTPDEKLDIVLSSIAGEYDAVQLYNASDPADPWKHYQVDKPQEYNDLASEIVVKEGISRGLWIHMLNDDVLIPDQMVPETGKLRPPIRLEPGWNFVGYPSAITRTVIDALSSVLTYDLVQTYDAGSGKWLSYDQSTYPPEPDDLLVMEMGRGYWIHCTSGAMWNIDYA